MGIQRTGLQFVTVDLEQFVHNVQKAQANLNAFTNSATASQRAIRGAAGDLNTHIRSLNAMTGSSSALTRAQSLLSGSTHTATAGFRGFNLLGNGLRNTLGGIGGALTNAGRGFVGLFQAAGRSIGTLTGFSSASKALQLDMGYLIRRVLLLSAAYEGLAAIKGFIKTGFEQVVLYDRMSKSIQSLLANEIMEKRGIDDFGRAMQQAAKPAKELYDRIIKLAVISTFESEDIIQVQQFGMAVEMSSRDAEIMTASLTAWGTVTQKTPETLLHIANALTDMFSKGKVQSEEMKQLARNGIPAWDMLAKSMGKSVAEVREMVSKGLIPADVAIRAIVDGMSHRYGPALKEFAFSWAGLTSSLRDLEKIGLREFFTGAFEAIQPMLERFVAVMLQEGTMERIRGWGKAFGELTGKVAGFVEAMFASGDPFGFLAVAIDSILPGFFKFYEAVGRMTAMFGELMGKAFGWGQGIGQQFAQGVLAAATTIINAITALETIISAHLGPSPKRKGGKAAAPATPGKEPEPGGGKAPIGLPAEPETSDLGLDASIFEDINRATAEFNQKAQEAHKHWDVLKADFDAAKDKARELSEKLEPLSGLAGGVALAFGTLAAGGIISFTASILGLTSPLGILIAGSSLLYTAWTQDWGGIQEKTAAVGSEIGTALSVLAERVKKDVPDALANFKAGWDKAWPDMSSAISNAAKISVEALQSLEKEGKMMVDWFSSNLPNISKIFNTVSKGIKDNIGEDDAALKLFQDVSSGVIAALAGDWHGFEVSFGQVMSGIGRFLQVSDTDIETWKNDVISNWDAVSRAANQTGDVFFTLLTNISNNLAGTARAFEQWKSDVASNFAAVERAFNQAKDVIAGWANSASQAIGAVSGAINYLIGKAKELIDTLSRLALPPDLRQRSPSPFEKSLAGVARGVDLLSQAFQRASGGFGMLGKMSEDIMRQFNAVQKSAKDLIETLKQEMLGATISGFDTMIRNLGTVRSLLKGATEATNKQAEAQQALTDAEAKWVALLTGATPVELTPEQKAAKALKDAEDAVVRAGDAVLAEKTAAQEEHARAQLVRDIADQAERELRQARAEYLVNARRDPVNAQKLFDLRSKQIKDLADIDLALIDEKDARTRDSLLAERAFRIEQAKVEEELFRRQAQVRNDAIREQINAIAAAWNDVFKNFPNLASSPAFQQFMTFITALTTLQLPTWLQPGSPTPLELGLLGIAGALRQLSSVELPLFRSQMGMIASPATAGQMMGRGGGGAGSYTYSPHYNLGVTTNQSPQAAFHSFDLMRAMQ